MELVSALVAVCVGLVTNMEATGNLEWDSETPYAIVCGDAAYYGSNVMERTAVRRGVITKTAEYNSWLLSNDLMGAVALYRKQDNWQPVSVAMQTGDGMVVTGRYLSIDVVAEGHYDLGIERGRVIDVDYKTAMRYGMRGPTPVCVIYHENLLGMMKDVVEKLVGSMTPDRRVIPEMYVY